jgi:hypothetical protein
MIILMLLSQLGDPSALGFLQIPNVYTLPHATIPGPNGHPLNGCRTDSPIRADTNTSIHAE